MSIFARKLEPFRTYRKLETDEHICIFADPADGLDYCAAVGISKKYQDTPIVYNNKTESSQFGHDLYHIAKYVEQFTHLWPTIGVERNTGQATIYVLVTFNYPDLFRMKVFDTSSAKESDKIGWLTTEATRKKMLDDLSLVLKQEQIKIYDKDIVDQLRSFVVNKRGRPQAESNKKDDLVIALAGAHQVDILTPKREVDDFDIEGWRKEQLKWRFK